MKMKNKMKNVWHLLAVFMVGVVENMNDSIVSW